MKTIVLGVLMIMSLGTGVAASANCPNFAGTYQMKAYFHDFPSQKFDVLIRIEQQQCDEIKVTEEGGDRNSHTTTYRTDKLSVDKNIESTDQLIAFFVGDSLLLQSIRQFRGGVDTRVETQLISRNSNQKLHINETAYQKSGIPKAYPVLSDER